MATAISLTNYQAAVGECYDAITSADWAAAWTWYAKAEAQNAGLELSVGDGGGASVARRDQLAGLREALKATQAAVTSQNQGSRFIRVVTSHRGGPR